MWVSLQVIGFSMVQTCWVDHQVLFLVPRTPQRALLIQLLLAHRWLSMRTSAVTRRHSTQIGLLPHGA
jgi:hypothetical protein